MLAMTKRTIPSKQDKACSTTLATVEGQGGRGKGGGGEGGEGAVWKEMGRIRPAQQP